MGARGDVAAFGLTLISQRRWLPVDSLIQPIPFKRRTILEPIGTVLSFGRKEDGKEDDREDDDAALPARVGAKRAKVARKATKRPRTA